MKPKKRDFNILLGIRGEISLKPRVVKSKKVYKRKIKHKKRSFNDY